MSAHETLFESLHRDLLAFKQKLAAIGLPEEELSPSRFDLFALYNSGQVTSRVRQQTGQLVFLSRESLSADAVEIRHQELIKLIQDTLGSREPVACANLRTMVEEAKSVLSSTNAATAYTEWLRTRRDGFIQPYEQTAPVSQSIQHQSVSDVKEPTPFSSDTKTEHTGRTAINQTNRGLPLFGVVALLLVAGMILHTLWRKGGSLQNGDLSLKINSNVSLQGSKEPLPTITPAPNDFTLTTSSTPTPEATSTTESTPKDSVEIEPPSATPVASAGSLLQKINGTWHLLWGHKPEDKRSATLEMKDGFGTFTAETFEVVEQKMSIESRQEGILLVGSDPVITENNLRIPAPGYATDQILIKLQSDGSFKMWLRDGVYVKDWQSVQVRSYKKYNNNDEARISGEWMLRVFDKEGWLGIKGDSAIYRQQSLFVVTQRMNAILADDAIHLTGYDLFYMDTRTRPLTYAPDQLLFRLLEAGQFEVWARDEVNVKNWRTVPVKSHSSSITR